MINSLKLKDLKNKKIHINFKSEVVQYVLKSNNSTLSYASIFLISNFLQNL